ncbi:hypothetical protein METBIDRAFT_219956 [Metschnikowia bicuspidata var. bicuspidata NRRL YB-4993]|uniref:Flo11 domain-containing protein n=1 Tax=Metschnikowia bicuspidata var. bicuspidata NRRL YB-4993 TaxID=869754 RepID=A0A1A0H5J4_9ASCO|nr:hypothetical protein METBIDRAFT_219956 [Metschnikowia bicuspidata var. bicuspidata NRRL YB-4993]OBA19188.1 hypothetical protein METBIDRAFT_219956 [Metschnikowia bicuspidata var. bicuspidata NRRL YB-4993]
MMTNFGLPLLLLLLAAHSALAASSDITYTVTSSVIEIIPVTKYIFTTDGTLTSTLVTGTGLYIAATETSSSSTKAVLTDVAVEPSSNEVVEPSSSASASVTLALPLVSITASPLPIETSTESSAVKTSTVETSTVELSTIKPSTAKSSIAESYVAESSTAEASSAQTSTTEKSSVVSLSATTLKSSMETPVVSSTETSILSTKSPYEPSFPDSSVPVPSSGIATVTVSETSGCPAQTACEAPAFTPTKPVIPSGLYSTSYYTTTEKVNGAWAVVEYEVLNTFVCR